MEQIEQTNETDRSQNLLLLEKALEMVLIFDISGCILYANDAADKKLEYEEGLKGKHICDVFPSTFKASDGGFFTEYVFGDEPQNLVAYRKNLTCFPVEARIMQHMYGEEIYICMANDILEKEFLGREVEQVRQEAQQAMKVKSEFVANVTHELRTPVNGILGNVREMFDFVTDEQTLKSLRLIERCCGDMNKLLTTFWTFPNWKPESSRWSQEGFIFGICWITSVRSIRIKLRKKGLDFS
ncbi:Sensor histidine kinase RcsC [Eubacterium plexicaudatum ASF492]|nr:Sensor histidine kinase RcsC [Eubacterium plexicaudatum ASF492]